MKFITMLWTRFIDNFVVRWSVGVIKFNLSRCYDHDVLIILQFVGQLGPRACADSWSIGVENTTLLCFQFLCSSNKIWWNKLKSMSIMTCDCICEFCFLFTVDMTVKECGNQTAEATPPKTQRKNSRNLPKLLCPMNNLLPEKITKKARNPR